MKNDAANNGQPYIELYIFFVGGRPYSISSSSESLETVRADFAAKVTGLPRDWEIRRLADCSKADLEYLALVQAVNLNAFNLAQIAAASRIGRSGLVAPPPHPVRIQ